jgi:hypothetical protein
MTDLPPPVADPSSRLAASRAAFAALRPRVAAGEPWPLAADFGTGPEASWGPREVLAHTAEMLPFWLGEFERIVEAGRGAGDGLPFGRVAGDALRIGILERDRTLPLRELVDRIDAGISLAAAWRWRGRGGAPSGSAAPGDMTADEVRDRFVIAHPKARGPASRDPRPRLRG